MGQHPVLLRSCRPDGCSSRQLAGQRALARSLLLSRVFRDIKRPEPTLNRHGVSEGYFSLAAGNLEHSSLKPLGRQADMFLANTLLAHQLSISIMRATTTNVRKKTASYLMQAHCSILMSQASCSRCFISGLARNTWACAS